MACTLIFFLMRGALQAFFQGIGRTKLIMGIVVGTNVLNVVLNWLLIFGVGPFPRMGVGGAGLATLISSAVGAAWFLGAFLLGRTAREHQTRGALAPSWARLKGLLRIGVPTSFQWSLDVAAWAGWHTVMIGRLGTAAYEANGAVLEITALAWFPVIGIGQASCSLVGWYLARGQKEVVRRVVQSAMGLSAAYMVLLSGIMVFGARGLMEFFFVLQRSSAVGTENWATVLALGVAALRIAATFQIFDGWNITLMGSLRGGGDTLWPAVASQALTWLFFLPLAWVMCFTLGWGMPGAWGAAAVHLAAMCGVLYLRYRGGGWMAKDIFAGESRAAGPMA